MTGFIPTRNQLRSRTKEFEFTPLSRDPFIRTNSDIEPQKLHALGVITFRWNLSENKLFDMFQVLLKRPINEAHALADGLKNEELARRIKTLASSRIKDKQTLKLISNVLDVYEICRQNRNQLTHFNITLADRTPGLLRFEFELELVRRRRDYRSVLPFPQTIKDIRRVARDIRRLNTQLWGVRLLLDKKTKRWMTSAPQLLPVPELLWKPPPQTPIPQAPRTPQAARRQRVIQGAAVRPDEPD
jgi:hypothetical protein